MSASTAVVTAQEPHPAGHAEGGISNPVLGMILFICSEVMFFAGLFAAYFNVRNTSPVWPPIASPNSVPIVTKELAERFDLHAEPWFALTLTILLIISSFTCQLGVWAIRRGDHKGLVRASA